MEFEKLEQTHVSLDDRTANVNTVTCAIQSKWESEYVVVTGDGLEVDDSSDTQGTWYSTLLHEIKIGFQQLYMFLKLSIAMSINHSCTTIIYRKILASSYEKVLCYSAS